MEVDNLLKNANELTKLENQTHPAKPVNPVKPVYNPVDSFKPINPVYVTKAGIPDNVKNVKKEDIIIKPLEAEMKTTSETIGEKNLEKEPTEKGNFWMAL